MNAIIDDIFHLFARFGTGRYGEDLTLELHMMQSAAMAEALGAPPHIVVAALLHDVGHFLHAGGEVSAIGGHDFQHEALGAAWLSRGFGEEVTVPIALHVQAKRYLCAIEPGYLDRLSTASRHSLALQGGVMTGGEVAGFASGPASTAAVILRRCDDLGKDVATRVGGLDRFRPLLSACSR